MNMQGETKTAKALVEAFSTLNQSTISLTDLARLIGQLPSDNKIDVSAIDALLQQSDTELPVSFIERVQGLTLTGLNIVGPGIVSIQNDQYKNCRFSNCEVRILQEVEIAAPGCTFTDCVVRWVGAPQAGGGPAFIRCKIVYWYWDTAMQFSQFQECDFSGVGGFGDRFPDLRDGNNFYYEDNPPAIATFSSEPSNSEYLLKRPASDRA